MKFIDLVAQQKRIRTSIEQRIRNVLDHGQYVSGPEIAELEERLARYVGVRHAVGCASGTDALLMALLAYGVGPADLIFTTPFTFMATAEVISLLGATPVFVDVDAETFNMDPRKLEETILACARKEAKGAPPRGIIPVNLFGVPADYEEIDDISRKYGLFVIEDAAQSFGAAYKSRMSCSLGGIGCTSFFPAKPLGCYGDGGMCFTDDEELAVRLRSLRVHGMGEDKYENVRIGINGRLDTMQAAILLEKFELFPEEVGLRRQAANRYRELFRRKMRGEDGLRHQHIPPETESVWAQYSLLARDSGQRSRILSALGRAGIPSAVYYPKPLHVQRAFRSLGYQKGDFPVSEDLADRIFSLPMHPYLSAADQEKVVDAVCAGVE